MSDECQLSVQQMEIRLIESLSSSTSSQRLSLNKRSNDVLSVVSAHTYSTVHVSSHHNPSIHPSTTHSHSYTPGDVVDEENDPFGLSEVTSAVVDDDEEANLDGWGYDVSEYASESSVGGGGVSQGDEVSARERRGERNVWEVRFVESRRYETIMHSIPRHGWDAIRINQVLTDIEVA